MLGIEVAWSTQIPFSLRCLTHRPDEDYLNSEKGQQELAESIAAAVKRYRQALEGGNSSTSKAIAGDSYTREPSDEKLTDRGRNVLKKISINQPNFKVDLYGDGEVDGDIVSVYYNGKSVVNNKKLTEKPLSLNLTADPSRDENELLIYAENEGDIAPNTALMIVTEGNNRNEVRITADSKKNGVVLFSHK